MPTYADYFTPNLTLLTCETVNRENVLDGDSKMRLLRAVLNEVRQQHRFRMIAFVFLRNHLHLLLAPDAGVTLDQIVHEMMRRFERDYASLLGMPQSYSRLAAHVCGAQSQ
ncbi:MAG: transposase [Caldilineaceae bacterium]